MTKDALDLQATKKDKALANVEASQADMLDTDAATALMIDLVAADEILRENGHSLSGLLTKLAKDSYGVTLGREVRKEDIG